MIAQMRGLKNRKVWERPSRLRADTVGATARLAEAPAFLVGAKAAGRDAVAAGRYKSRAEARSHTTVKKRRCLKTDVRNVPTRVEAQHAAPLRQVYGKIAHLI